MYGDVTGDDFQKNNVEDVLMYPSKLLFLLLYNPFLLSEYKII